MNENFNDVLNKFSDILKEKNIDLNGIMNNNSGGDTFSSPPNEDDTFQLDFETIQKIKEVMDSFNRSQNNPRNQLLKALKPYLQPEKKEKLDQYIKIANIISVLDNLELGTNFNLDNKKGYDFILIITLLLLIL